MCSLIAPAHEQEGERSCNWVNLLYCANSCRKTYPAPAYLNKIHLWYSDSVAGFLKAQHLFGDNTVKIADQSFARIFAWFIYYWDLPFLGQLFTSYSHPFSNLPYLIDTSYTLELICYDVFHL